MTLTKKILPLAAVLAVALPGGSAMAAPKSKFRFSQPTYVTKEGDSVQVTITRTARRGHSKTNQTSSVNWSITGGSASTETDYSVDAAEGTLTFAPDDTSKTLTFTINQDLDIEGLETIGLKLSAASNNALITNPRTAQILIADDDGPTQIQLEPAAQSFNESVGTANFYAVRSGDITGSSSVHYATSDGSAAAGSDYTAASGDFSYGLGEFSKTIAVAIKDDGEIENPETFNVALSNVNGATLGNASATATIIDNDSPPVFALDASSYEVNEDGSVDVTVQRRGNAAAPKPVASADVFNVTWGTTDGTATNPADYVPGADQQLEFDASDDAETITIAAKAGTQIALVDDTLVEGDETFGLSLLGADIAPGGSGVAPAIDPTASSANVTIHDNDSPSTGNGAGGSDAGNGGGAGNNSAPGQTVLDVREAGCGLTVKASKKQKLLKQKTLKLTVKTTQRCKVTVSTLLTQVKAKKKTVRSAKALRFKGRNASLTPQPGKAATVKVKFTKKTLKAITKALRARKNLVATVVVTSKDSASKVTRKTLKITIRR